MDKLALASINTFGPSPKADFEPPSEQLTALTDLIKEAIQPLKDEVAQLQEERDQDRQEIAALRAKLAALEKDRDTLSENQLIQLKLINGIRDEIHKDKPAPAPTRKTEDHIQSIVNALHGKEKRLVECQAPPGYLKRYRSEGMTFSDISGLLGVTVDRVRQLSRIAATDQRLIVAWHPRKKNTKIFRLSRWDASGL